MWLNTTITYLAIQIIININTSKYNSRLFRSLSLFFTLIPFFHYFSLSLSFLYYLFLLHFIHASCLSKRSSQSQKDIIIFSKDKRKAEHRKCIKFMKYISVWIKQKSIYEFLVNATFCFVEYFFFIYSSLGFFQCVILFILQMYMNTFAWNLLPLF